ncbi:MAG: hypothetical protein PHW41_09260, partial [Eubacteriales bacterium]|nr:hypothetical protein [Eubacteriales bacterium]
MPETTPTPSQAIAILCDACADANGLSGDSAAYAAEMLRWEAGFISRTSKSNMKTKTQRIDSAFDAASRLMKTRLRPDWTAWIATTSNFEPAVYDSYAQNVTAFMALADALNSSMQLASATCVRSISE